MGENQWILYGQKTCLYSQWWTNGPKNHSLIHSCPVIRKYKNQNNMWILLCLMWLVFYFSFACLENSNVSLALDYILIANAAISFTYVIYMISWVEQKLHDTNQYFLLALLYHRRIVVSFSDSTKPPLLGQVMR